MMEKILKVLWLSNVDLLDEKPNKSGTWIHSMFKMLKKNKDGIEVCANITFTSQKKYLKKKVENVSHYYVPEKKTKSDGYPSQEIIDYVVAAIKNENPTILHIWGMETCWGLITRDQRLKDYVKLLEIQGIKSICSYDYSFFGGLSCSEIRKMRTIAQWLLPIYRMEAFQKKFARWELAEQEILQGVNHINTQSEWVRSVMSSLNKNLTIHNTGIILRDSFIKEKPWNEVHKENEDPVIFTTTSPEPRKGFHVTFDAFKLVKNIYPNAKLYVAGMSKWKPNLFRGGYNKYIYNRIKDLNIEDSVMFLGNLGEAELLENMYLADVFVISSFIETYCLALAEALAVGVPIVSSYSSALPELVRHGETGFLVPMGDKYDCAAKIELLLSDNNLKYKFSHAASSSYRIEKDAKEIVTGQISTYKEIAGLTV